MLRAYYEVPPTGGTTRSSHRKGTLVEFEHATEERMRRETAAERLRALADDLSRQNKLTFVRDGKRFTVAVPEEVTFEVEIEIEGDGNELEVEIRW